LPAFEGGPDEPGERRRDAGVAQVERGLLDAGLGRFDLRASRVLLGDRVVELPLADRLLRDERRIPRHVVVRLGQPRLSRGLVGPGLRQDGFERLSVDRVQEVALAHDRAFLEVHGLQVTFDARPDFHVLVPLGLSDQFQVDGDVPLNDVGDEHFGGRRRRGLRLLRAGTGQQACADDCGRDSRARRLRRPGQPHASHHGETPWLTDRSTASAIRSETRTSE